MSDERKIAVGLSGWIKSGAIKIIQEEHPQPSQQICGATDGVTVCDLPLGHGQPQPSQEEDGFEEWKKKYFDSPEFISADTCEEVAYAAWHAARELPEMPKPLVADSAFDYHAKQVTAEARKIISECQQWREWAKEVAK